MENLLSMLKTNWNKIEIENPVVSSTEILLFEGKYQLMLPEDLKLYFTLLNGTDEDYDSNFFCFYSLSRFKNIKEELGDWTGTPDYRNLLKTFKNNKTCFVFADYQFHMFSYAIQLYEQPTTRNEVYTLCGDKYKLIASTFTDFLNLYIEQSTLLQF